MLRNFGRLYFLITKKSWVISFLRTCFGICQACYLQNDTITSCNGTNNGHQEQINLVRLNLIKKIIYGDFKLTYWVIPGTKNKNNALCFFSNVSFIGGIHEETLAGMHWLAKFIQIFNHKLTFINNRRDFSNIALHSMFT